MSDLKSLHRLLADEEAHLKWFDESGQSMGPDGSGTAQYRSNLETRISELKRRIADYGKAPDEQ